MQSFGTRLFRSLLALLALALATGMGMRAAQIGRATYLGMSERGDVVALVTPNGPADRAGLRSGDRLLAIDGRTTAELFDAGAFLRAQAPNRAVPLLVEREGREVPTLLVPELLPPSERAFQIAHAVVALLTLLTGTVVHTRKSGRQTAVFFGICIVLAFLLYRPQLPATPDGFRTLSSMVELCSTSLPGLVLHFFLLFPYERAALRKSPWLLALVYGPGALLFLLAIAPDSTFRTLGLDPVWMETAGATGAGFLVLTLLVFSLGLFVHTIRTSHLPTVQRMLKVTLWGSVLGLCPMLLVVLLHTLLPSARIPGDRLATLMVFFLPASFGYAIVRHGAFEIEFIVKRSLIYSALTALFVLAYFVVYFALSGILSGVPAFGERIGSFLLVLFAILVLSPIRGKLQDRIDRWIYPDRYDTPRLLRESALLLRDARTPEELAAAVLRSIHILLGVERAAFFTFVALEERFTLLRGQGVRDDRTGLHFGRILADPLFRLKQPTLRADLESELPFGFLPRADLESLNALETQVLVPLGSGSKRLAILLLGPRSWGEIYSAPDLMLIEGLQAQAALALENALFLQESEGHEGLHREMEVARSLQQQLLPHSLPKLPEFELAARNLSCHEVGGDYYDCLPSNGRGTHTDLTLAIGDVSGKGVPAALLMANVQAGFRAEALAGRDPDDLLSILNQRLCAIDRPERFVSLFCGKLETDRRRLRYSNGGHPPPILLRQNGTVDRLERGGLLLGIRSEERYEGGEVALTPGDVLVLFTDGLVERGGAHAPFGEAELEIFVARHRHLGSEDLLDRILAEVERVGGPVRDDDTTVVVVKAL